MAAQIAPALLHHSGACERHPAVLLHHYSGQVTDHARPEPRRAPELVKCGVALGAEVPSRGEGGGATHTTNAPHANAQARTDQGRPPVCGKCKPRATRASVHPRAHVSAPWT